MSNIWDQLRHFTQARIGLGRAGHALPTRTVLELQAAHASARDAVWTPWEIDTFAADLGAAGLANLILATAVADRADYLRRPDLGRRLSEPSREQLRQHADQIANWDILVAVTNGLSSTAVERHGLPLVSALVAEFTRRGLSVGPICLAANGRVALADDAGQVIGARLSVIVVGERPGLSAADSLGIYLTFAPRVGNTDAERNCISNIRPPEGLDYGAAALKCGYLASEALRRGLSGVNLKDEQVVSLGAPDGQRPA